MAKGSIFGTLSGKIGTVVVYERNGKQIVRSNPKQRDPKTPAQLAHRMKFSLVNKGMSPLNKIIKFGYRNSEKNYRKLVGVAYHTAIVGEYPDFALDYSKIQIAEGDLQLPDNVTIKAEVGNNIVSFCWDPQMANRSQPGRESDMVNIVCLYESFPVAENLLNTARRSDGNATIDIKSKLGLSDEWNPSELHFWLYLSSNDLTQNSDSVYVKCR